jgi:hypothetical protein
MMGVADKINLGKDGNGMPSKPNKGLFGKNKETRFTSQSEK